MDTRGSSRANKSPCPNGRLGGVGDRRKNEDKIVPRLVRCRRVRTADPRWCLKAARIRPSAQPCYGGGGDGELAAPVESELLSVKQCSSRFRKPRKAGAHRDAVW